MALAHNATTLTHKATGADPKALAHNDATVLSHQVATLAHKSNS